MKSEGDLVDVSKMAREGRLRVLLEQIRDGGLGIEEAAKLLDVRMCRLGHSTLDLGRAERTAVPEVVFALGKSEEQLGDIVRALLSEDEDLLITKLTERQREMLEREFPQLLVSPRARIAYRKSERSVEPLGSVAVVSAGTSDDEAASEAAESAEFLGLRVLRVNDVGVAGLERLLSMLDEIDRQDVVIAVAGMEGALASVLSGLTRVPIIAVPTSVGYGASFGGLSALLGMLVSCSPGITVVNIDNGFGAAAAALKIIRHLRSR